MIQISNLNSIHNLIHKKETKQVVNSITSKPKVNDTMLVLFTVDLLLLLLLSYVFSSELEYCDTVYTFCMSTADFFLEFFISM